MQRVLSFDQTPRLSVPFRFFLTAPLFAAAAALLLFWSGPEAITSRWSPLTLTLTHLLTLGFLAMTMIGALLQILPVVVGVNIPRVRATAGVVYVLLLLGTLALCFAFRFMAPALFKFAVLCLTGAFLWLLVACSLAVFRASGNHATLIGIRLALIGLLMTVTLGAGLAAAFAAPPALPFFLPISLLVDLHAAWGLIGWVALLIIGVAYQVVPMFQVTPAYPIATSRWLTRCLFALLAAWSVSKGLQAYLPSWCEPLLAACIAAGLTMFGLTTLYLLWKRRRTVADPTTVFWHVGLLSLLLCAGIWAVGIWVPELIDAPAYPLILGVLLIVGFAYSIVNGMLYKIVPFLVWYHLQAGMKKGQGKAPNVKKIVTDTAVRRQSVAHVTALAALIAAVVWPQLFSRLAGITFAVSSLWLWANIANAIRVYKNIAQLHNTMLPSAAN